MIYIMLNTIVKPLIIIPNDKLVIENLAIIDVITSIIGNIIKYN